MEMNILEDHIHMVTVIPPKISISELMGILKGKDAISIFKKFPSLKQKPQGESFLEMRILCKYNRLG